MDAPKISVIIPLYNRRQYIEQCLDSALNQTFKDYEIIVRDDGSTDGSAEFVEQRYANEISSGKLKLRRNKKNIGEFPTDNKLINEATGKYIMILHSDDMYLPHALAHMYAVAENFSADVVHCTRFFTTAPDGVIKEGSPLKLNLYDRHQVKNVEVFSDDPFARFDEWLSSGIGIDAQHNIFNRNFVLDNNLSFARGGNRFFALKWITKAKVFVKTPVPVYIYRDSPDSITNSNYPPERVTKFISSQIELARQADEFFTTDDFFKDKPDLQYNARSHLFFAFDVYRILRNQLYRDGLTPELHRAVEDGFRKHFGDDAAYPTFLFHWIHAVLSGNQNQINTPPRSCECGLIAA